MQQTESLFSTLYLPVYEDGIPPEAVTHEMLQIGMPYTLVDRTYGRGKFLEKLPHTELQFILDLYGACTGARIWVGGRTLAQAWDGRDIHGITDESPQLMDELMSWRQWFVNALFPFLSEMEFKQTPDERAFQTWLEQPFQSVAPLLMYYVDKINEEADNIPCKPGTYGIYTPARQVANRLDSLVSYEMEHTARTKYRALRQARLNQKSSQTTGVEKFDTELLEELNDDDDSE